jgi:stage III sporulation protein AH
MVINFRKAALVLGGILILLLVSISLLGGEGKEIKQQESNPGEQVLATAEMGIKDDSKSDKENDFFAEYRLERERVRGRQIEMLQEIINKESTEKEARLAASLRLVEISEYMEREMKIEHLVKSQGFSECVVIIQPESSTLVVHADSLRLDKEEELRKMVSRLIPCSEEDLCIILKEDD